MRRREINRPLLLALVGTSLILLTLCTALLLLPRIPFFIAQQRWQNRSFDRYRIQVEYSTISKNCYYDVEIAGHSIDRIHQNWCDQLGQGYIQSLEPWTVDEILNRLAAEQYQLYCSPAGCRCGTPVINEVDWNMTVGFPQQWIKREAELPFNIELLPPCPVEYPYRAIGRIVKLEPLN